MCFTHIPEIRAPLTGSIAFDGLRRYAIGQRIEIENAIVVDDSIIVSTDRSLTGTDGEGFGSATEAGTASTFGAKIALDLFEADDAIDRVFVASNVIVVKRGPGWDQVASEATQKVIEEFFLFYPEG